MTDSSAENQPNTTETVEAVAAATEPPPAEAAGPSPDRDDQKERAAAIAGELRLKEEGVAGALALFDAGYAVPFVAYYRRAETGNLSESQLEAVYEAYLRYRSLADRRKAILQTLSERGVLSESLREAIYACRDKIELEDLYLPLKRRERTKATIAVDNGLGPLADLLTEKADNAPQELAEPFVRPEKGIKTVDDALQGAADILSESFAQNPGMRRALRARILSEGKLTIHPTKSSDPSAARFKPLFDTSEPLARIAPQKFLMAMRGVRTGALRAVVEIDDAAAFEALSAGVIPDPNAATASFIRDALRNAYDQSMRAAAERDAMTIMQDRADAGAIAIFRENARARLMAAPAGSIPVLGIYAGKPDSVTLATIDAKGEIVSSDTVSVADWKDPESVRAAIAKATTEHAVQAIAIGRGDHAGDVLRAVRHGLAEMPQSTCYATILQEASHPVSTNAAAADSNMPADVASAACIARQHQNPLHELAKIDPRHVGIGQNFHEVNQKRLREALQRVMTSCICRVGLNLNAASATLLGHICGVQPATAINIVKRREESGPFTSRRQLLEVAGVGPKVFEQAAPFLRIQDGEHPLDSLSIHPDHYEAIESAVAEGGIDVLAAVNDEDIRGKLLDALTATGLPRETVDSIRHALRTGRRDPRGPYHPPRFDNSVRNVSDLTEGQVLEGVVTNVADFGAFVEVGVGQDGLVHLSELANGFVRDPRQIVSVGQTVKVKVVSVDVDKPRISLSIKALQSAKPRRSDKGPRRKPDAVQAEQGEAQPRGRREDAARRPSRKDDAERSPDRRDAKGPQRRQKDRPQRPKKKSPGLPDQDNSPLTNNPLADQLAALKDRFGS